MNRKPIVHMSLNCPDGWRCVDVIKHPSGLYSWCEFRRDPEDPRGWRPIGTASVGSFANAELALADARRVVGWLNSD